MAAGRLCNSPHLPYSKNNTPPTLPSIYNSIYTEGEITRESERECMFNGPLATVILQHTHTHSNQTHKSCWLRNTCTSHRQTGCGGVRSLLYFPFPSIRSPLLSFVFLRGMQNKLRSLIEHCLFAYAVCIVLVHDSLKELCTIASLCHCNQCTWVGYRLNLIDSDSFRFQCD